MTKGSFRNLTKILLIFAFGAFVGVALLRNFNKLPVDGGQTVADSAQKRVLIDEESTVINVVEKVSPSVVSIAVENRTLFDPFFGVQRPSEKQSGIGTGFVVSGDGLILTNKHVVSSDREKYIVVTVDKAGNKKEYEVKKITRDPSSLNDMALIKIDAADLVPVE